MLKFEEDVEKYKSKTKGKYALFVRSDPRLKKKYRVNHSS